MQHRRLLIRCACHDGKDSPVLLYRVLFCPVVCSALPCRVCDRVCVCVCVTAHVTARACVCDRVCVTVRV